MFNVLICPDNPMLNKSIIFEFSKEGIPTSFQFTDSLKLNIDWVSNNYIKNGKTSSSINQDNLMHCLIVNMFKNYAQVETKELKPQSKLKEFNCKYVNDTKLSITHLDSKWFTNFFKSDEFKVRGHFRLQPKKKFGEWTKELIWINEFKKSGYTAPARMLSSATSSS